MAMGAASRGAMKDRAVLALVVLWGLGALLLATAHHMGADPDSTVYIGVAKNWVAGRGLTMPVVDVPLTHYPPLYPLVLGLGGLLGIDLLCWAWMVNAVLLVANTLLARATVLRMGGEGATTRLSMALVASSPGILSVYWMVWSEPLLLFLGFMGLLLVDSYLRSGRAFLLVLGAAVLALGWLDRYVGIAFIAGAGATLGLYSQRRVRDLLLFGVLSLAPMGAWLARNLVLVGNAANRKLALHAMSLAEGLFLLLAMALAVALYSFLARRRSAFMCQLLTLTILAHAAVVVLTASLIDETTPVLDTRIWLVVLQAVLLMLPLLAGQLRPKTARMFTSLLVVLAMVQLLGAVYYTRIAFEGGLNYSDGQWEHGDLAIPAHPWDDPD